MALEFMDGFDLYGDNTGLGSQWVINNAVVLNTTGGRWGGCSVDVNAGDETIRRSLSNTTDTYLTVGFSLKVDLSTIPTNFRCYAWTDTNAAGNVGNANGTIYILPNGAIELRGDSGGPLIGSSSAGTIITNSWQYIEVQIQRNASGTGRVYVNGSQVISGSGDFLEGTADSWVEFGSIDNSVTASFDDIYADLETSAFTPIKGDLRIETLLPNADTAQADWTPLSGSGFSNIDDAIGTNGDGDTSYISETTLNNKSEFDMENLTSSPVAVHAVALVSRASKTDAGTIAYTHYLDNGTELQGTEVAPANGAYGIAKDYFESQPGSPSQWDATSVNGLKIGFEITS